MRLDSSEIPYINFGLGGEQGSQYSLDCIITNNQNLLSNPGFEEWAGDTVDAQPDGWDDEESITAGTGSNNRESATVKQGLFALRIEVNGLGSTNRKGIRQDIRSRVTDGITYNLSVWVKNAAITNGSLTVGVWGNSSGWLVSLVDSGNANNEWTKYSGNFTPVAADTTLRVVIQIYASSGDCTGTAYIDRMMVVPGSTVPDKWYDRTDKAINLEFLMTVGQTLTVDCADKIVRYEQDDSYQYQAFSRDVVRSEWLILEPDIANVLQFAETGLVAVTLKTRWRDRGS